MDRQCPRANVGSFARYRGFRRGQTILGRSKIDDQRSTIDGSCCLCLVPYTNASSINQSIIIIMTNFGLLFGVALLFNVVVTFRSSEYYKKWMSGASSTSSTSSSNTKDSDALDSNDAVWQKLLKKYLIVYLLATLSDWLQGPYVYALYDFYQYSQHDIAVLFVAGFGSSMVFGSFVGGMADVGGRKLFTILFAVVYAASCLTKRTYCERPLWFGSKQNKTK